MNIRKHLRIYLFVALAAVVAVLFYSAVSTSPALAATILFPIGGGTGSTTLGAILAGGGSSIYSVATGTVSAGSGITVTGGQAILGSGLTITNTIGYPFTAANNATSTLTQFNGGLTAYASSTIGAGAQTTGLTISGGATTTGNLVVQGAATSTFVNGISATYLNLTGGSATSTFGNGADLSAGCWSISGTCLQTIIGSASAYKQAVKYASTSTLPSNTYSNGVSGVGATITGVALAPLFIDGNTAALGDRILVKNEATGANNGIYTVTTAGVAAVSAFVLTRATDYNSSLDVFPGVSNFTNSGTVNANTCWILSNTTAVTIGTTALTYDDACGAGSFTSTWPIILSGTAFTFGGLSTSTAAVVGNIPYYSGVNTFANVATGTVSAGSTAITVTAGRSAIGGALAIDCAASGSGQNGCLSSTDWSTFNNKISWGSATSTNANQSVYTNALGKLVSVATSTPTISSGLSYSGTSFGDVVGGGSGNLTCATGSGTVFGCLTAANFLVFNNKVGTSSNATAGNLAYYTTTNGTPALIADVATGTVSGTNGITVTAGRSAVGGALAIDCTVGSLTVAGCISVANSNLFNNKIGTSTGKETAGQLGYYTTTSGTPPLMAPVSTTSVSAGTGISLSASAGALVGGSALTITNSGVTSNVAGTGITVSGSTGAVTITNTIGYPFAGANNSTSTLTLFSGGLTAYATSTIGSGTAVGGLTISGGATTTDVTNGWSGATVPTSSFVLSTGTTTSWTASTTNTAYSPFLVMPFAGTLRQVRCATDASFLGVNVQVNGSNATPSYFVSSTTVGQVKFTSGNTFTAGQKILANFGTTTSATTLEDSCTFDYTITP